MQKVVVFCGARHGADPIFTQAAQALGTALAASGRTLVYGGGHVGLMGVLADAVLDAGGQAIGVIPHFMVERELAHGGLTELVVVDSMHTRKARMAELGDAFVAMPGGFGTLDELFEILTWAQIGLHGKPVGLLNTGGYFDSLLDFMRNAASQGFVNPAEVERLVLASEPDTLLQALAAIPVADARWRRAELRSRS
ncbi:putative cytokinin riboside 5'-monophosphate phosphoribohydrolase [Chitiniphilus shinanonensis]|uniref:Cytokinin riboside 5'-monophosphate phosphoribohydrolase n=1 Tax=Chitiniphilus shinanonensis TaxID=553088 RepID=A0ABQ6BS94_9NEIS|nr:TIGR00730 family Rossman fold protein [Chitiniphilus shinanonensis]GLS04317.1 putative cytokinin riboside 5'-monophosphate phosphoribohydrolase [Chitiniphilus shinanonensis]